MRDKREASVASHYGSVDLRDRIFEIRMPEAGQIALGLIFADLRD